jgi:hypothetical protein
MARNVGASNGEIREGISGVVILVLDDVDREPRRPCVSAVNDFVRPIRR